jgi:hypothetical protein
MDEQEKAVEAELHEAGTTLQARHQSPLFTVEIERTTRQGVYSIKAYDEDGVQIAQVPVQARATSVIQAVSKLIVDAGVTGSLPMVGVDQMRQREESHEIPRSGGTDDADFSFTDILEGVAGALRKAGVKR